ncbi:MAG: DUF4388 domain-containing protein [Pseudomonadota bacterium]
MSDRLPPRGELSGIPAYVVILWAKQQSFTGLLTFERDTRVKHLYLENGAVIGSRSNLISEDTAGLPERLITLAGWFSGRYSVHPGVSVPSEDPTPPPIPLSDFFSELELFLLSGKIPERALVPVDDLPVKGSFRETSGAGLFFSLALRGATGRLLFARGQRKKLFELERGVILSASSSDPRETLAEVLRRCQILPFEKIRRLESICLAQKARFRDLLREGNFLSESGVSSALLILHSERVLEAFSWRSGNYEFRGEFVEEPSQRLATYGAVSTEGAVPAERQEPTEKELLLVPDHLKETAGALTELFGPPPNNSLLLASEPAGDSFEGLLRGIAACWKERDGIRTLIVTVGAEGSREATGSLRENPGDSARWIGFPDGAEGAAILRLTETGGIDSFAPLRQDLGARFDRILWSVPIPGERSPLLDFDDPIVLVLTANRTEKKRMAELLERFSPGRIAGFLFREVSRRRSRRRR